MAFSSETVLKFGSTAISFVVITLLDYRLQNEKVGAFPYRRVENISLEGYFSNRESSIPIEDSFSQINNLIRNSIDFVDLKLNDKSYGKVRFTGFSFPSSVTFDENSIRFTKINIQLEVLKDDSSGTFASDNLPSSVKNLTTSWYKLKNFSESLTFRLNEENNFEASHSISFGYDNIDKESNTQVISNANQIANQFFALGLDSLSSIRSFYSNTDFQISASDYGSSLINQTVDLINYNFSYSKDYIVFSDNGTNTTETLITEINFGQDGIITVSEKGRIKGKGNSHQTARSNAISKLNSNLDTAFTRCGAAFTRYFTTNYSNFSKVLPKYNSTDDLQSQPISISKDLSEFGTEVGYEVTFSTNNSFETTRIHSYAVNLTKTPQGVYEATIDGNIKYYTNKNKNFYSKISDIKSIIDNDTTLGKDLITPYYQKVLGSASNYSGIKTEVSINHLKFGVDTSYTKTYSNATTLKSSGIIRQIILTQNLSEPVSKFSTVNTLPSRSGSITSTVSLESSNNKFGVFSYGKEAIYQTRQYAEGTKNITLDIKVNRDELYTSGSSVNTNPNTVFAKIKDLFKDLLNRTTGDLYGTQNSNQYALKSFQKIYSELNIQPGELIWFLEDLKLSIDNSYNLRVYMVFKYLLQREAS